LATTGDLKKRWQLIAGFSIVAGVLFAGSHTVLPGWIGKFYEAVIAYRQYTGGSQTLLDMLIGRAVGTLLNALLVLTCIVVGWRARREPEESPKFLTVTVLVLSVTVVIVPMVALYNQVLLIPGLLFLFNSSKNFGNPLQIHAATKPVRVLVGNVALAGECVVARSRSGCSQGDNPQNVVSTCLQHPKLPGICYGIAASELADGRSRVAANFIVVTIKATTNKLISA
jgi:MFS family permease